MADSTILQNQLRQLVFQNQKLRGQKLDLLHKVQRLELKLKEHNCFQNPLLLKIKGQTQQALKQANKLRDNLKNLHQFEISIKQEAIQLHVKRALQQKSHLGLYIKQQQVNKYSMALAELSEVKKRVTKQPYKGVTPQWQQTVKQLAQSRDKVLQLTEARLELQQRIDSLTKKTQQFSLKIMELMGKQISLEQELNHCKRSAQLMEAINTDLRKQVGALSGQNAKLKLLNREEDEGKAVFQAKLRRFDELKQQKREQLVAILGE